MCNRYHDLTSGGFQPLQLTSCNKNSAHTEPGAEKEFG